MSFILDALRKSENERKRNELPGLADSRVQKNDKSRKLWIPLVALLVGINLSLLIVMWLTSDQKPTVSSAEPVAETAPVTAPVTPPAAVVPPVTSVEPTVARTIEPPRNLLDELDQEKTPAPALAASTRPAAPPVQAENSAATDTNVDRLPTLLELTLNNAITVPPLHLDIHVFSEQIDERFVFINMSKYREGERISEGPLITEITKTGVVMNHQGSRFLLLRD